MQNRELIRQLMLAAYEKYQHNVFDNFWSVVRDAASDMEDELLLIGLDYMIENEKRPYKTESVHKTAEITYYWFDDTRAEDRQSNLDLYLFKHMKGNVSSSNWSSMIKFNDILEAVLALSDALVSLAKDKS